MDDDELSTGHIEKIKFNIRKSGNIIYFYDHITQTILN